MRSPDAEPSTAQPRASEERVVTLERRLAKMERQLFALTTALVASAALNPTAASAIDNL